MKNNKFKQIKDAVNGVMPEKKAIDKYTDSEKLAMGLCPDCLEKTDKIYIPQERAQFPVCLKCKTYLTVLGSSNEHVCRNNR